MNNRTIETSIAVLALLVFSGLFLYLHMSGKHQTTNQQKRNEKRWTSQQPPKQDQSARPENEKNHSDYQKEESKQYEGSAFSFEQTDLPDPDEDRMNGLFRFVRADNGKPIDGVRVQWRNRKTNKEVVEKTKTSGQTSTFHTQTSRIMRTSRVGKPRASDPRGIVVFQNMRIFLEGETTSSIWMKAPKKYRGYKYNFPSRSGATEKAEIELGNGRTLTGKIHTREQLPLDQFRLEVQWDPEEDHGLWFYRKTHVGEKGTVKLYHVPSKVVKVNVLPPHVMKNVEKKYQIKNNPQMVSPDQLSFSVEVTKISVPSDRGRLDLLLNTTGSVEMAQVEYLLYSYREGKPVDRAVDNMLYDRSGIPNYLRTNQERKPGRYVLYLRSDPDEKQEKPFDWNPFFWKKVDVVLSGGEQTHKKVKIQETGAAAEIHLEPTRETDLPEFVEVELAVREPWEYIDYGTFKVKNGSIKVRGLPTGSRMLRLRMDGYREVMVDLQLPAGEWGNETITLHPK